VLIWNVQASPDKPVEIVLCGHRRAISDLHWSPYQSNMIASSALDTDIHLWDLRTPQRPASTLCAWTCM
jgi:WD40 repeat protein